MYFNSPIDAGWIFTRTLTEAMGDVLFNSAVSKVSLRYFMELRNLEFEDVEERHLGGGQQEEGFCDRV